MAQVTQTEAASSVAKSIVGLANAGSIGSAVAIAAFLLYVFPDAGDRRWAVILSMVIALISLLSQIAAALVKRLGQQPVSRPAESVVQVVEELPQELPPRYMVIDPRTGKRKSNLRVIVVRPVEPDSKQMTDRWEVHEAAEYQ